MNDMAAELDAEGVDVRFVGINSKLSEAQQPLLVAVCSFPLFQDTALVDAWGMHGGAKDDFFIYRPDGTLSVWLDRGGPVNTTLSTAEGRANLRQAILDAQP